jgi:hypothetical protein
VGSVKDDLPSELVEGRREALIARSYRERPNGVSAVFRKRLNPVVPALEQVLRPMVVGRVTLIQRWTQLFVKRRKRQVTVQLGKPGVFDRARVVSSSIPTDSCPAIANHLRDEDEQKQGKTN